VGIDNKNIGKKILIKLFVDLLHFWLRSIANTTSNVKKPETLPLSNVQIMGAVYTNATKDAEILRLSGIFGSDR
jgi:hypothetical protein